MSCKQENTVSIIRVEDLEKKRKKIDFTWYFSVASFLCRRTGVLTERLSKPSQGKTSVTAVLTEAEKKKERYKYIFSFVF